MEEIDIFPRLYQHFKRKQAVKNMDPHWMQCATSTTAETKMCSQFCRFPLSQLAEMLMMLVTTAELLTSFVAFLHTNQCGLWTTATYDSF